MRRIASGTTDQYVYFQRQTGLSSFTVYRSRNGGAWAAMTTPTISEGDSSNAPGIYELLLDEDMTIGAGNVTEHMAFYVTHAGMSPVFLEVELFVPPVTSTELSTALGTADDAVLAAIAALNNLSSAGAQAAAEAALAAYGGALEATAQAIKDNTDKFANLPVLTAGGTGGQGYGAP